VSGHFLSTLYANRSSPFFSSTTLQKFQGISDPLSEVSEVSAPNKAVLVASYNFNFAGKKSYF
jgi:hypothetical protein